MNFKFLHCADLHLDSPLIGLNRRSPELAERVDNASRKAFDNLIALAIDEECPFIVIAGDVFDGQWRDYGTGLFFADRMRRLGDHNIDVYMILGNHDAENRFASRLTLSENVRLLSHKKPESIAIEALDVVIHGRSFPQRDVIENIAADYPAAVEGAFNIGLLHTACLGREGHQSYAPCSVEQLVNHGYDYWALGHVHTREVLSSDPYVVFPGNLQGRNRRELGAKGASLVTVQDGRVSAVTHRPLDVVRWAHTSIDVSQAQSLNEIFDSTRDAIDEASQNSDGRALALRLSLRGETPLHHELIVSKAHLSEEFETIAAGISADVFLDGCDLLTSLPVKEGSIDPSIAGDMQRAVEALAHESDFTTGMEEIIAEFRSKIPPGANLAEFLDEVRAEVPSQALERALVLIERGHG